MTRYTILAAILLSTKFLFPQDKPDRFRIMFYNVENLFDPFDDSLTNDDEFTPNGTRHWTWDKMNKKLNGLYKTIMAVGEWDPPALIGLCEVENRFVLTRLVSETPILKFEYKVVHHDSPDPRGIDVALLYRPDLFVVEESRFFKVNFQNLPTRNTREILYVRGLIGQIDTLHVFVNHWPSKFGGELESESGRYAAAYTLRQKVDSIFIFYPNARILILGDFNDEPESDPIIKGLQVLQDNCHSCAVKLVNISAILKSKGQGSYKYQGTWGMIDQIIISTSLQDETLIICTSHENASVFKSDYLMELDEVYLGDKPFRTYSGYRYIGGFSDHLPVYIDLIRVK